VKRHVREKADVSEANVKRADASGRSQNYMPPEAGHALEQAQKAKKSVQVNQ
jgi:hypothetical protein